MLNFTKELEAPFSQKQKSFFWIFYCISEMCIKFRTFGKKKDEYPKSVISKIIDSERGGYLNV